MMLMELPKARAQALYESCKDRMVFAKSEQHTIGSVMHCQITRLRFEEGCRYLVTYYDDGIRGLAIGENNHAYEMRCCLHDTLASAAEQYMMFCQRFYGL